MENIVAQYLSSDGKVTVSFSSRPDDSIRESLKKCGFRYDGGIRSWIADDTEENRQLAMQIVASFSHNANDLNNNAVNESDVSETEEVIVADDPEYQATDIDPELIVNDIQSLNERKVQLENAKSDLFDAEKDKQLKEIDNQIKEVKKQIDRLKISLGDYLSLHAINHLQVSDLNISFTFKKTYSLSEEYVDGLKQKMNLPKWIDVKFSLKPEVLKEMIEIPDGIVVEEQHKVKVSELTAQQTTLNLFREGLSINEISEKNGTQWKTEFSKLKKALMNGQMDISELVNDETYEMIRQYSDNHPDTSNVHQCLNLLNGAANYDQVILVLSTLREYQQQKAEQ